MTGVFEYLAGQPVLTLFLLVGVGMAFGHIKIKGIGLGPAAVLFAAIILSAWSGEVGVELTLPPAIGTLGLVLFAFAIGINSGNSFFHNLKTAIAPLLTMIALFIVAAASAYLLGVHIFGLDISTVAGTFAGAVTNTPALAAAGEASGNPGQATVGYSIAYIFGVLGMIAASMAALAYSKTDKDAPTPIANRTVRVERTDHPFVGDLYEKMDGKIGRASCRERV